MLRVLPSYCFHLEMNRDSLLSILYGIHYMKPIGGPKVQNISTLLHQTALLAYYTAFCYTRGI
jgi:hypothetical protein